MKKRIKQTHIGILTGGLLLSLSVLITGASVISYQDAMEQLQINDPVYAVNNGDFAYTPLTMPDETVDLSALDNGIAPASVQAVPTEFTITGEVTAEKTQLVSYMLNSIDYLQKISVDFLRGMRPEEPLVRAVCESDLDTGYALQTSYSADNSLMTQICSNGEDILTVYYNNQQYAIDENEAWSRKDDIAIPLEERMSTMSDGIPNYTYRRNITNCHLASYTIFPQELTFSYLKDFSTWDIVGNETYLDRTCVVVYGIPCDYIMEKHVLDTFTMYIDSETGVLMRLIGTLDGESRDMVKVLSCDFDACSVDADTYSSLLKTVASLDYTEIDQ